MDLDKIAKEAGNQTGSIIAIKFSDGEEVFHNKLIADQLYESFMNGIDEYYFSYQDEQLSIYYQRGYVSRIIYLEGK